MYFHEDLSLGEIGEQLGVSRQAVYDILRRSAAIVEDYEAKLALVTKHLERTARLERLMVALDELDARLNKWEGCEEERELLREARGQLQDLTNS